MKQKGSVNGYKKVYWSGITTLELAKAIDVAIEENVTGLIHLTNGYKISKYDLLILIKEIWNKNEITVLQKNGKKVDKSLMKSKRFKYIVPSYEEMLEKLFKWMRT